MVSDHRRPLVIFSLVVVYVILQFAWWAYLLLQQNGTIQRLQQELLQAGVINASEMGSYSPWMVIGEGSVFLLLLLLGLWLTYRTLRRELLLATVQYDFLLAVTHELRTPIAAMRLNLQTMQREDLSNEQRTVMLEQAIADTGRLELLGNKILMVTQIEERTLLLDQQQCNVAVGVHLLLDQVVNTYAKDHRVERVIDPDLYWTVDEGAFRSICDNLVENACKYSPKGSTVRVILKEQEHNLHLGVEDEGTGVPEPDRPYIFDKFHRSTQQGHQAKGSGLGLYIVASLVKLMNGRIMQRNLPKRGSVFEVVIPMNERSA